MEKTQTTQKFKKLMWLYTLEAILNSKLDKWVGSNLWSTPLAAASCTDAGDLLLSKRFSRDSIAASDSWIDEDDEHIISDESSESRIKEFEICMFWCRELVLVSVSSL